MQSDTHIDLFRQLQATDQAVRTALAGNDYDALPNLLERQCNLFQRLKAMDPCEAPSLVPLMTETRDRLTDTMAGIRQCRDSLAAQMKTAGTKRMLAKAYGV